MSDDHHPILPPSSAPALEECCHYKPTRRETAAMARGIRIHAAVQLWLEYEQQPTMGGLTDEEVKRVEQVVKWVNANVWKPCSEERLDVVDLDGREITFGTPDVAGYDMADKARSIVVELKCGEPRDVTAQLSLYALGAMEAHETELCRAVVLWLDHDIVEEYPTTFAECLNRALLLRDRVTNKTDGEQETRYCAWCGRREECGLWKRRASTALQVAEVDAIMHDVARRRLSEIAESPELTGAFLVAWAAAEKLIEGAGLRDKAKAWLAAGQEVPGWKLRAAPGRESVSVAALRAWAKESGVELPDDLITRGQDGVALIRDMPSKRNKEEK